MHTARTLSIVAALAAVGATATSPSHAQSRSDATVYDRVEEHFAEDEGPGARATVELVPVAGDVRSDGAGGCAYRARVEGVVRVRHARGAEARYAPDVRVRAVASCGGASRAVARRVRGEDLSRAALERALGDGARAATPGRRSCEFAPDVVLAGERVAARRVALRCAAPDARGGGPAPGNPRRETLHRPVR